MSDLHVGHADLGNEYRRIITGIIHDKGDKPGEYVIVITGDLINDAHNQDENGEIKTGLAQLKQAGFEHVLVVPGNHDYGTGTHGDKRFVSIFKQNFFGAELDYPKKDIIDEMAFIGLDSMAEELNWYDAHGAEGELGDRQRTALADMLRQDDVRACRRRILYLHHHPFHWRPMHQLKDSEGLKAVLHEASNDGIGIDAVLYGHNHQGSVQNGKWTIPRCYDAGTATLKKRPYWVSWFPWYRVNCATRVIRLEDDELRSDYILQLPWPRPRLFSGK